MNRREALKSFALTPLICNSLYANNYHKKDNSFKISMFGDLDDDLIVIKSTPISNQIVDIYQMHNSSKEFFYDGNIYPTEINPGIMQFSKKYTIEDDEVYIVFLANEMEDAKMPINKRIRTHYKNENLLIDDKIFLNHLMPEYNSVANYPLWFNEGDIPYMNRDDINGNTYNYYNLFENSVVQTGLIFPKQGAIKIFLFNQNNELKYTFEENITQNINYLKSNELKSKKLLEHPFVEVGNILNKDINNQIENNEYLTNMLIEYNHKTYNIKFPYPAMYPNLFCATALN